MRALHAKKSEVFLERTAYWPIDIREHAHRLAEPVARAYNINFSPTFCSVCARWSSRDSQSSPAHPKKKTARYPLRAGSAWKRNQRLSDIQNRLRKDFPIRRVRVDCN
ncbi:MAG: hypothetical protein O2960_08325 [Verrucomicrobia bacterium]|nr:hypothetical protein [Verrucomicrobiota bacterium]